MTGRRSPRTHASRVLVGGPLGHSFTLVKGLRLLGAFRPGEAYLGNKELAERTELTRSTVSRLAGVLVQLGYLRYAQALGKYSLGTSVLTLAYPMLAGLQVRQIARPFMKALADTIEGQVSLGMASGDRMVFIESSRYVRHRHTLPEAGATIPILASAMGRAYLVALSKTSREDLLVRLRASDPHAWEAHAGKIQGALHDVVRLGFALSLGDVRPEMHACAVALRTRIDEEILVMNCSVPVNKLRRGTLEREIGPRLVQTVREVDAAMGTAPVWRHPSPKNAPSLRGDASAPLSEPRVRRSP